MHPLSWRDVTPILRDGQSRHAGLRSTEPASLLPLFLDPQRLELLVEMTPLEPQLRGGGHGSGG